MGRTNTLPKGAVQRDVDVIAKGNRGKTEASSRHPPAYAGSTPAIHTTLWSHRRPAYAGRFLCAI